MVQIGLFAECHNAESRYAECHTRVSVLHLRCLYSLSHFLLALQNKKVFKDCHLPDTGCFGISILVKLQKVLFFNFKK